jgi:three-Cys-motif partner protein
VPWLGKGAVPARKTPREWLARQIGFLHAWGEEAGPKAEVYHDYGAYTGLKLAALNHAVGVFSRIAGAYIGRWNYDGSVFVDLFAGCGVTKVRKTGDYLAGSPIIAAHAISPFTKIICVERRPEYASALRARMATVRPSGLTIIEGDCNLVVDRIVQEMGDHPLAFVNVDPEGMEILWRTMERLAVSHGAMDFMINLTYGAERELAAARGGKRVGALEDLAGANIEDILLDPSGNVSEFYEARVREVLGKRYGDSTLIRGEDSQPLYRLLLYTRKTRGDSPFAEGYADLHKRLSGVTAPDVLGALNDLTGRSLGGPIQ